jgi:prepilin-type N-terminal cleavage/methylation domain-containing protein
MRQYPEKLRRGVTLIELMVSVTVAGLAILAARYLIETIDDAGTTLSAFALRTDRVANGDRFLRALLSRAEVSSDSLRRFRGDSAAVSFDTWCEAPAGWLERCRVILTINAGVDSSAVTSIMPTAIVLHLVTVGGTAVFRYVTRDSTGIRRLDNWGRSITAPYAVFIESANDTLVLIIGDRG